MIDFREQRICRAHSRRLESAGQTSPPVVLHILTRLAAGGPPLQVLHQTRALKQRGFRAVLATGSCAPDEMEMSYLLGPQDEVIRIPEMSPRISPGRDLAAIWQLARCMRKLRPHIVHTHTSKAGLLGRIAARLAAVPIVLHSYHGTVFRNYFSAPISAAVRCAERYLARHTDLLLALSQQQAGELIRQLQITPPEKVAIVPAGIDLTPFLRLPPPAAGNLLTVGWFGRFVPVKNIALLARIVESAHRARLPLQFIAAGCGPDEHLLRRVAESAGVQRLHLSAWQADITPLVAACDVLLLTSRNEGTPLSLIQGMAAGRPFVSTAAGGVVDMVSGAKRPHAPGQWYSNGVLTAPDAEQILVVLMMLWRDRRRLEEMGAAARRFAATHYHLPHTIPAIADLYLRLIEIKLSSRQSPCMSPA